MMRPLGLTPVHRIWGGVRLKKLIGREDVPEALGEVFIHDGQGPPALALKWIDAQEVLSVQNHPSRPGFSKREAWFFVEPPESGSIICGLVPPFDAPDIEDRLQTMEVQAGDIVEVPSGCVHALTPGSLVLEVQEPLDVTYRIYDWGRGRETHLESAREAYIAEPLIRYMPSKEPGLDAVIDRSEFTFTVVNGPFDFEPVTTGILTFVAGARFGKSYLVVPGETIRLESDERAVWAA